MIGPCGPLLIIAAFIAAGEARGANPRASQDGAQSETIPAGLNADYPDDDTYRDRAREAIREVLSRREFSNLHADPYAYWRKFFDWIGRLFERLGSMLHGMPEWALSGPLSPGWSSHYWWQFSAT